MFKREYYLNELIDKQGNGLIKVITGIRRSGKSFLLNKIFYDYLVKGKKVDENKIIRFAFDNEEDIASLDQYLTEQKTIKKINGQKVINNRKFLSYIQDKTKKEGYYYLLIDEIQNLESFVRVLNSFLYKDNIDVYVTISNSRFLSSEVDTEFGGRGDRIHLLPLTFNEYLSNTKLDIRDALNEYIRYGGIPLVQLQNNDLRKTNQAISILNETYIKDLKLRHPRVNLESVNDTLKVVASMISTLINPNKIANTFKGVKNLNLSNDTISEYIKWFEEAYLLNIVLRYDVKGRKYIGSPYKIYFEDVGIRNAILNFREVDETDLIENIVYNELRYRGFNVDVGVCKIRIKSDRLDINNNPIYDEKATEVDFVANKGNKTYYVQVAYEINNEEKKNQEYQSLRNIPDSFKKVIIVKNEGKYYYTDEGFLRISLLDFLINEDSLDW